MWRFSYNHFLAKLDFVLLAVLQIRHLFLCARDYIQRTRGSRGAHVNLEANRVVDFSSDQDRLDGTRQSGMSMRFKKVCPQCDATLHVRKLACPCGHVFPAKAQQLPHK